MAIDWKPLLEILNRNERFILTSHVRPDADAIGSELGMAALLDQMGKRVRIINPSGMPAHLEFLDPNRRILKYSPEGDGGSAEDADVHIILDTSAWVQLGDLARILRRTPAKKVIVDHHVSSDDLGADEFKDTTAEATGTLVVQLADALKIDLPVEAAAPLFAAIATDTGWFRFPSTNSETMRIAGRLMDLGAEPHAIFAALYERRSPARLRLPGKVLSRVELACGGQLAFTSVSLDDFKQTGAKPVDTEDLVNECLMIDGTRAAFIVIEQPNKSVKVSFRSRSDLNVAAVAERFGGGGHKQAAGAVLTNPLPQVITQVRGAMAAAMGCGEATP
ncbi:MAG: bifunctional oligoribonuclease/PAP phosphatase NrnA [Planctomycetaceae bacterium]